VCPKKLGRLDSRLTGEEKEHLALAELGPEAVTGGRKPDEEGRKRYPGRIGFKENPQISGTRRRKEMLRSPTGKYGSLFL